MVFTGNAGANNLGGGTIGGATDGIYDQGGAGTVTNAGIISGVTAAVAFKPGFADRVIVDPGAVFSGLVNGGNTIGAAAASTLELASGAAQGLMSGLGTQFINFAHVTIDAGAFWTLDGANTLAAGTTLTNAGVLTILDGSLADAAGIVNNNLIELDAAALRVASLSGTGVVQVGAGGMLTVTGAAPAPKRSRSAPAACWRSTATSPTRASSRNPATASASPPAAPSTI